MMVDDTENNEFRKLLSEYSAPIDDAGFAANMLIQVDAAQNKTAKNTSFIKSIMIGGAALMASFIAVPQLSKLRQLVEAFQFPEITLPEFMPTNLFETSSSSYLMMFALLAVVMVGMASSFLFGQDL